MKITKNLGMLLLAVLLILEGLGHFGLGFQNEPTLLAILSLAAGFLILVNR